jgi:hypothetical protein
MRSQGTVGDMLRTRRAENGVWVKEPINIVREKVKFWKRVASLLFIVDITLLLIVVVLV